MTQADIDAGDKPGLTSDERPRAGPAVPGQVPAGAGERNPQARGLELGLLRNGDEICTHHLGRRRRDGSHRAVASRLLQPFFSRRSSYSVARRQPTEQYSDGRPVRPVGPGSSVRHVLQVGIFRLLCVEQPAECVRHPPPRSLATSTSDCDHPFPAKPTRTPSRSRSR
jgi:hypothetical protein